jgi:hypothetical protein
METTNPTNPNLGTITRSAFIIEKIHRCAECPIRKMAIKRPRSIFARLHAWHKTWWPAWKAHEERACAFRAMAETQS